MTAPPVDPVAAGARLHVRPPERPSARVSVDEAALRRLDALSVDPSASIAELAAAAYDLIDTREPIPPALSADEAESLVDALDNAARHRGHMDHEMFADSGRAASAANVAAARAAIIAALTGRATDAALAEAEARRLTAALSEFLAALDTIEDASRTAERWDDAGNRAAQADRIAAARSRAHRIAFPAAALTGREGGAPVNGHDARATEAFAAGRAAALAEVDAACASIVRYHIDRSVVLRMYDNEWFAQEFTGYEGSGDAPTAAILAAADALTGQGGAA